MTEQPRTQIPELAYRISWTEWVRRWNACDDQQDAIGLLHTIFDVQRTHEERTACRARGDRDKILFLLELADRHNTDRRDSVNNPHVRDKAFAVLSSGFFKLATKDDIKYMSAELRDKMVWFFLDRGGRDRYESAQNVYWDAPPEGAYRYKFAFRAVSAFLREFCEYFWNYEYSEIGGEVLEILHYHNALPSLIPRPSDTWYATEWDRFKPHLEKLKELALRDAPTVERGLLIGSDAARLYHLAAAALKEREREEEEKLLLAEQAQLQQRLSALASSATQ